MSAVLLKTSGLSLAFGGVVAADAIDFELREGERLAVVGQNGAGKTTFLNICTGYLKPNSGQVWLDGHDITGQAARIIAPGPVLCLADGEGRNSVWLARQGLAVTAVDVSKQGLRKANALARQAGVKVATVAADLTGFEMGEQHWGAIVSIFLHLPPKARAELHARCLRALRPGGVFIYEAYGASQLGLGTGGPKEPVLLPQLDKLEVEFPGGQFLHRFEGLREVHEGRLHHGAGHVVQLVVSRVLT